MGEIVLFMIIAAVWNILGFLILAAGSVMVSNGPIHQTDGWEFVNPVWIYKSYRVNIFGCILITIWYNGLCPIAALAYWIYVLATVGRK